MVQAKPFGVSAFLASVRSRTALPRGWALPVLVILLLFTGQRAGSLWREWYRLQVELSRVRRTAVIGYANISPRISYAQRPENWFHHEGDFTLLWSGWDAHQGHRWFRIGRGDLEEGAVSPPIGRDVFQ